MQNQPEENQPLAPLLPPADAVEEEEEVPVVDPDNDDGYEADDEGDDGWAENAPAQLEDPFDDDDIMSVITDEGEEEENGEQPPNNLDPEQN